MRTNISILHLAEIRCFTEQTRRPLLQGQPMAFGTSTAQSVNHPHHDDRQDDEQRQNRQNLPSRKFIVGCRNLGKRFAALFQDHSHSIDTLRHAAIEIVLPKGRQHELHLNPFADRIGQNALQSTAGNEAYFMPILDQQNAQTIIVAGISDTPTPEQFDGKRKASPLSISSTATTATCANPFARNAAQTSSMRLTAPSESMPSGLLTYRFRSRSCTLGTSSGRYVPAEAAETNATAQTAKPHINHFRIIPCYRAMSTR